MIALFDPTRSESRAALPAKLAACSAALLAGAAAPPAAHADDLEGVARAADGVEPTSAVAYDAAGTCQTCPPASSGPIHGGHPYGGHLHGGHGIPVPGLPLPAVPGVVAAVPAHLAGKAAALHPDGYIGWGEIGTALRNKPALIPPLGHYDAYLPPDYGWQAPIAYPVQRVPVGYTKWYPNQWYGLPGSQKPRTAPVVFMPTDTSQLGYYHQQVPTWQPLAPGSLPGAPDPRTLHHRTCPAGPDVGVYGGTYPNAPRAGLVGLRDRLHGRDHHGLDGGTVVTEPAVSGPACPAGAAPAAPVISDPLPTSTGPAMDPVPSAPAPSFAPPAGDPLPAGPTI